MISTSRRVLSREIQSNLTAGSGEMNEEQTDFTAPGTSIINQLAQIAKKRGTNNSDRLVFLIAARNMPHLQLADELKTQRPSHHLWRCLRASDRSQHWLRFMSIYRNSLVHGQSIDALSLWSDQEEIQRDLNTAIIQLVIRERPELLKSVIENMLSKGDSPPDDETRVRLKAVLVILDNIQDHETLDSRDRDPDTKESSEPDREGEEGEDV